MTELSKTPTRFKISTAREPCFT